MIAIARVTKGNTKMATARNIAELPGFELYRISEIIEMMRSYERSGLVMTTETEYIVYHIS